MLLLVLVSLIEKITLWLSTSTLRVCCPHIRSCKKVCARDAAASFRSPDPEMQAYAAFRCSWGGSFWQIKGTEDALVVF